MSLKGLLVSILGIIGFDGVLGGVTGVVCSVLFGVLSTLVNINIRCNCGYDNVWQ